MRCQIFIGQILENNIRFRLLFLHQRFEPRLKAIQKTGSTAQVPLPFSLARPLPRSPLRSADGHRNRDAIVPRYLHISPSPIGNRYSVADSVRSLQLPSAPPALVLFSIHLYYIHFIIFRLLFIVTCDTIYT